MPAPAARLFLAGLLIALAPGAWAVELLSYRPDGRLLDLFLDQGRVLIEVDTGGGREFHGVILADGRLGSRPAPDYRRPTRERPIGILPDGIVTYGSRNIAAAWLAGPTDRYDHAVLGDAIEAGEIRARDRRGRVLSARLPDGSVFEDRRVRLADLDGDGGDELVVVRSYPAAGAALSVWRAAGEGLTLVAETPPIGRAY
ncbi:MAG: hypothetical protein QF491_20955, partial [Alphaproteobacteria bacterium]|nr:hypothetical protein [Alphaproteobacteria bacterium]